MANGVCEKLDVISAAGAESTADSGCLSAPRVGVSPIPGQEGCALQRCPRTNAWIPPPPAQSRGPARTTGSRRAAPPSLHEGRMLTASSSPAGSVTRQPGQQDLSPPGAHGLPRGAPVDTQLRPARAGLAGEGSMWHLMGRWWLVAGGDNPWSWLPLPRSTFSCHPLTPASRLPDTASPGIGQLIGSAH